MEGFNSQKCGYQLMNESIKSNTNDTNDTVVFVETIDDEDACSLFYYAD